MRFFLILHECAMHGLNKNQSYNIRLRLAVSRLSKSSTQESRLSMGDPQREDILF